MKNKRNEGLNAITKNTPSLVKKGCDGFRSKKMKLKQQNDVRHKNKKVAFTLAEILITLGIIGVVVALTIPTLLANYKKKATVAKLKKVYTTLNQAYRLSEAEYASSAEWANDIQEVNTENVKKYVEKYWLPYLKIIKNCSSSRDCSYPNPAKTLNNSEGLDIVGNDRYTLILPDGIMLAIVPFDWDGKNHVINGRQSFYVDLNGAKAPNVIGKDVFVFTLNLVNNRIDAFCQQGNLSGINQNCSYSGPGHCCAAKIIRDGWEIKNDYPW